MREDIFILLLRLLRIYIFSYFFLSLLLLLIFYYYLLSSSSYSIYISCYYRLRESSQLPNDLVRGERVQWC